VLLAVIDGGAGGGADASENTFLGLGLMACAVLVVWLIRRARAER
jgi:hypothetical protein